MAEERHGLNGIYHSLVDTSDVEVEKETIEATGPEEKNTSEVKIQKKKVVQPATKNEKQATPEPKHQKPMSETVVTYFDNREKNYHDLQQLIDEAEKELADLKFRKVLMESDFPTLLDYFKSVFIERKLTISAIAKSSLLEYFTFELLKPLESNDLRLSNDEFATWRTKHFSLTYRLVNHKEILFSLMMPTPEGKARKNKLPLLLVQPETMHAQIKNQAVFDLLTDCYIKRIYTSGQNSIFSHQMNEVMNHMQTLGFTFTDNLLDNTKPLQLTYTLPRQADTKTIDDIFITTMDNQRYDFKKRAEDLFVVELGNEQTVTIKQDDKSSTTTLTLDTNHVNKSLIEFFGAYPFLVPLALDNSLVN